MASQKNRLTKKKDFDAVFSRGKKINNGFLVVRFLANNLLESRFGFVVSKKVSPKAVVRNKIRRRLKNIVLCLIQSKKPTDIVLVALPGIEKQAFLALEKSVAEIFKKVT